jgi:RNA polymerase sigma-70 factor (ECF subfamily)
VDRALGRVPEPFRAALQLVDVEDQSYESAAETLGVPVGTVRSRLFRGRRLMQELLAAHAHDAGLARAS